jgi:N-methylhydantoinase A
MRYAGQGTKSRFPATADLMTAGISRLRARFDGNTQADGSGHTAPEEPVEVISYRLRGIGCVPE